MATGKRMVFGLLESWTLIALLVVAGTTYGPVGFIWGLVALLVVENIRMLVTMHHAIRRLRVLTTELEARLSKHDDP